MSPRSILAMTDFSRQGNQAFQRAKLLAAEHGATLRQISPSHGMDALLHHARAADLVVWGSEPVRSLRTFFAGQPVEQLLRRVQRPVLLVRNRARQAYRSVLVAVDFSHTSPALVEMGFAISQTAPVQLFHAVNTVNERKLRQADVPDHVLRAYREECLRDAQERMAKLADARPTMHHRLHWAIGRGDPSLQALAQGQRSGADLIVVGKHPASAAFDWLLGSVATRLVDFSADDTTRTDVLIVPHDWQAAPSPAADDPMPPGRLIAQRVRAGRPKAPAGPNPAAIGPLQVVRAPRGDRQLSNG
jgi:nucleotide-binding universal stress UspA family protein